MEDETLQWLMEGLLETLELDPKCDRVHITKEVRKVSADFDEAVNEALARWAHGHPESIRRMDVNEWLSELPDAAYAVFMTLNGEGVGTWDGRWDKWFRSDSDIRNLNDHLKKWLSGWAEGTGTGKLNEVLMNTVLEQCGESEEEDE